jgi:hypothetical protein
MMGIAGPKDRLRSAIRVAVALSGAAIVAGCSTGSLPSLTGSMPSWFSRSGGSPAEAQAQAAAVGGKVLDEDCPSTDVRTGAGTLAVAAKPQEPTANDLRYQLTFIELARQCVVDGTGTVRMRVGVQGRAVVGPAGAPPQITAPIRYAVVQEGVQPKTIVTKLRRVPVQLGSGSVVFTDIEDDLSFPLPPIDQLQRYVVYVGFDDAADRGQAPAKKAPKAKKKLDRSVAPELR